MEKRSEHNQMSSFYDKVKAARENVTRLAMRVATGWNAMGFTFIGMGLYTGAKEDRRAYSEDRREIDNLRSEYSQCISNIAEYSSSSPTAVADFKSAFGDRGKLSDPIKKKQLEDINKCRSFCRDYWARVHELYNAHGGYISLVDQRMYKGRHGRFVKFVRPLDVLPDYSEEDGAVYDTPRRKWF
jgi:hypothetical protein